jgi:hypothetical protein
MGVAPKLFCARECINPGLFPPTEFVTDPVRFAMVSPAKGDNKFIADFASERSRLGESQVVRIRGLSSAYQAGAMAYPFDVHFISEPANFRERKDAFVDLAGGWRDRQFVSVAR